MINMFKRKSKDKRYAVSCILYRKLEEESPIYQHTIHDITAKTEDIAKEMAAELALENYYNYKVIDTIAIEI